MFTFAFGSLCSCEKNGTKDPIIVELDGNWQSNQDNVFITFDKDDEQFSMTSDRGDIELADYSADPSDKSLIYIYCYEFDDQEDYMGNDCKITFTDDKNSVFISNLPYFEGETIKIFKN